MILQTSTRHKFIDQKSVLILEAVPNQFYEIRMVKLPQIINFCLQV